MIIGCASRTPASPTAELDGVDARLPIIVAAMDGALEKRRERSNLFVDPRLMGHTSAYMPPDTTSYAGVPQELNLAFRSVLSVRDIPMSPAFDRLSGCSGLLVAPEHKVLDACPMESLAVLAFGLPRPGMDGLWEVPMASIGYLTKGSTGTTYKVEVRRVDDRFEYVREVPVLEID